MSVTEKLADIGDPIWDAVVAHPMVEQLGEGTLDESPFRYWVRQDYVYLVEYARVFALGAANAPDLQRMGTFAELLDSTINTEMDLHRAYAADFGISEAELEATDPSPTTRAYTDFLVRTAATGTFGDLVAALLPCMWGFNEKFGEDLCNQGLTIQTGCPRTELNESTFLSPRQKRSSGMMSQAMESDLAASPS